MEKIVEKKVSKWQQIECRFSQSTVWCSTNLNYLYLIVVCIFLTSVMIVLIKTGHNTYYVLLLSMELSCLCSMDKLIASFKLLSAYGSRFGVK